MAEREASRAVAKASVAWSSGIVWVTTASKRASPSSSVIASSISVSKRWVPRSWTSLDTSAARFTGMSWSGRIATCTMIPAGRTAWTAEDSETGAAEHSRTTS